MKGTQPVLVVMFILFFANLVQAQNGYFLHKKVKLSFAKITHENALVSLELYQNGAFDKEKVGRGRRHQHFSKDSITQMYTLSYTFSGIGSGSEPNYLKCPELLVKLNFANQHEKDSSVYTLMIPIILQICSTEELFEIEVLNIDLTPCINQPNKLILVEENNKYQVIDRSELETEWILKKLVKIE